LSEARTHGLCPVHGQRLVVARIVHVVHAAVAVAVFKAVDHAAAVRVGVARVCLACWVQIGLELIEVRPFDTLLNGRHRLHNHLAGKPNLGAVLDAVVVGVGRKRVQKPLELAAVPNAVVVGVDIPRVRP
jgi:hypothetical protein